ncbi:calcium-translocating P-type ATPase [Epithele typhae]|uniref:calcium-translocating P-type ATPase n=1 Tax=Epithele typhae TaxID=378194 RepID=UPI002007E551|nr:calcium-translocating P-type ATPase [Epithele typhae]KAH9910727.1 calcium-translocating P-type ATPase [Epithele typhae]
MDTERRRGIRTRRDGVGGWRRRRVNVENGGSAYLIYLADGAVLQVFLIGLAGGDICWDGLSMKYGNGGTSATAASLAERARVYGVDALPPPTAKNILMWDAYNENVLPAVEWVKGVAIMVAIVVVIVVVLVDSLTDWQLKERQFRVLNAKGDERAHFMDVHDVVVGNVALIEPGDIIPCDDGVLLSGHGVRCDESGATEESEVIKKMKYRDCLELWKTLDDDEVGAVSHTDCFLISGSKILESVGSYVIVAVGPRSFHGRIMTCIGHGLLAQDKIAVAGSLGGLILFVGLLIRYFVKIGTDTPHMSPSQKGLAFVDILILSFTLVVASVPEAIALALAFASKRMTRENLLVRVLNSCKTMANASVIRTDKTGTLTQNTMSVVAGAVGGELVFVRDLTQNPERASPDATGPLAIIDLHSLNSAPPPPLDILLNHGIAINSTAFEDVDANTGVFMFVETALLAMARDLGLANYKAVREAAETLQAMSVVVRLPGGRARLYVKGASEVVVAVCARQVVATEGEDVMIKVTDEDDQARILESMTSHASQTLRTIAVCHRDFDTWPPKSDGEVSRTELARDVTLAGVFALRRPPSSWRPDSVLTARSIATQCGTFTPGGIVMEGPPFHALSDTERRATVQRLQVLAHSSPEDKRVLVNTLKELGEIVEVTGDGTNDGPALKVAHIGFFMGVTCTEVAKEAFDIAIVWGRAVNDAVRKFLQFQVTPAVVVTLVSALAGTSFEESVLSAVQLLWVAIVIETFAALALSTDCKPELRDAPLFTINMIKQILGQSAYQVGAILALYFRVDALLGFPLHDLHNYTVVFNAFVFAQIFNSTMYIFEGVLRNLWFMGITFVEIVVFAGVSLPLGVVSIPLGALIRMVHNDPCERAFKALGLYHEPTLLPTNQASLDFAHDELTSLLGAFRALRGGRLHRRGSSKGVV